MIDPAKTYKTRDGREVRIYAVDGEGDTPIHGAIWYDSRYWRLTAWDKNGRWSFGDTKDDLIEVKPRIKREVWVNVYPDEGNPSAGIWAFRSKPYAEECSIKNRLACVKVTIDCCEGDGL